MTNGYIIIIKPSFNDNIILINFFAYIIYQNYYLYTQFI